MLCNSGNCMCMHVYYIIQKLIKVRKLCIRAPKSTYVACTAGLYCIMENAVSLQNGEGIATGEN